MRVHSAVVALMLAGLGVGGKAVAAPYVGQSWEGSAQVRLVGTDGNLYQVAVTITVTSQASSSEIREVDVSIARCRDGGCGTGVVYSHIANSAELAVSSDGSSLTLRSSFGGSPLRVTWGGGAAGDTEAKIAVGPINSTAGNGGQASKQPVTITVLSATCSDPNATSEKVVTVDSTGSTAAGGAWRNKAPSGFTPKRGRRTLCAAGGRA